MSRSMSKSWLLLLSSLLFHPFHLSYSRCIFLKKRITFIAKRRMQNPVKLRPSLPLSPLYLLSSGFFLFFFSSSFFVSWSCSFVSFSGNDFSRPFLPYRRYARPFFLFSILKITVSHFHIL